MIKIAKAFFWVLLLGLGVTFAVRDLGEGHQVATSQSSAISEDITAVHFNDLEIMRYHAKLRAREVETLGEVTRLNYAFMEDRSYASNQWGGIKGGVREAVLMHPRADSALYFIYRELERAIAEANAKTDKYALTAFQTDFILNVFASAQSLALVEEEPELYRFLVHQRTCFSRSLIEDVLSDYEARCFDALKRRTYEQLNIDPTYKVSQGDSIYTPARTRP